MGCTCVIHLYPTLCTLLFYLKLCMYHIFVSHTVHDTLVFQVQMCQTLEHQNAHMYYSCIPNKRFLHKCACVLTCTGFNTLHCWSLSSFLELKFDLIILRWETDEKYTKKLVFHTALVPNDYWNLSTLYLRTKPKQKQLENILRSIVIPIQWEINSLVTQCELTRAI